MPDGCREPSKSEGTLGILAGAGAFPLEIASSVNDRGRRVHIVAIRDFAEADVGRYPHEWVGLGQVGRMISSFRRAGCREIVIAGGMKRPDLLRLKPDLGVLRHFPTILALTRGGDDSVLRRIVRFFEAQGFSVKGAGDTAPELMAPPGPIGSRLPNADEMTAIERASRAILSLGSFDIGQAAVATAEGVISIETARGTDALLAVLEQNSALRNSSRGGVLVKLAKPGQELRVDLPAIGPRTIEGVRRAGLSGIAIGAGRALVLEREVTRAAADAAGLFVLGLGAPSLTDLPERPDLLAMRPLTVLARRAPTPSERRDNAIGRQLLDIMQRERLGDAAVIAGEHVLAVSARLEVPAMLRGLGRDAQWGRRWFRRQIGSLALNIAGPRAEQLLMIETFQAARDAGLAGLVCVGGSIPDARFKEIAGWANDAGLFLMSEEVLDG